MSLDTLKKKKKKKKTPRADQRVLSSDHSAMCPLSDSARKSCGFPHTIMMPNSAAYHVEEDAATENILLLSVYKLRFSNSLPVKMISIIPFDEREQSQRLTEGQTKLLLNPNNGA